MPCSNRLARQYSSRLRAPPEGVHGEPLAVLVHIGWLELAVPAKRNFHAKSSARYRLGLACPHEQLTATDDHTTPCVARKLQGSLQRREAGLNRRFKFRQQLLVDLAQVSVPPLANKVVDELLGSPNYRPSTLRVLKAIGTREHSVRVGASGLIVTSLISCPRDLKPLLYLSDESVSLCDIASAHFMFLPRLVADRIDYCRQRGDSEESLAVLLAERCRLIEFLSGGPVYPRLCKEGATPAQIKTKKTVVNMLLNSPSKRSENHKTWKALRQRFPLCVGIIEAIKKDDHRKISKQLQHFTANAITAALQELQALGIPAIPDTDSLIVRKRDREAACAAIGKAMYDETRGVLVTVDGIKFAPAEA